MESLAIESVQNHRLGWASYRFKCKAQEVLEFPEYSASLWRSLFGAALRRSVCVTRLDDCQQCMLAESCAYVYLFETRLPTGSDRMRRYNTIPHPFIIKNSPSNRKFSQGESFNLEMVLFGQAARQLPYIIQSLIRAGKMGLFRERRKFSLTAVQSRTPGRSDWQPRWLCGDDQLTIDAQQTISIPDMTDSSLIEICFTTPFRFMQQKKVVSCDEFRLHHLYRSLSRRISMLAYFYDNTDLELAHKQNIQSAERVPVLQQNLRWVPWSRYSARQQNRISMAGIIGSFRIDLSQHENLWPVLWLGQFTHAGKGTSMGLGEYRITTLAHTTESDKLANSENEAGLLNTTLELTDRRMAAKQDRG